MAQLANRPHTYLPLQVFAEADKPSQLFQYYLLFGSRRTKNGLSRSEQKTVSTTQNSRLTGKAPYKFLRS